MKFLRNPASLLCLSAAVLLTLASALTGCGSGAAPPFESDTDKTPAEQNLGERIFIDTRFAEYFAAHMTGVNDPLTVGDPVVAEVQNAYVGPMAGPFAGQSINCRSCHFVVEFQGVKGFGNRTYADFTTRSPIPLEMNGFSQTPRNAMQMVGSLQHPGTTFLHFDGEFVDPADLVKTTLTGRNFGWGPTQYSQAIAHIARIIREDNGNNVPSQSYTDGYSYAAIFAGGSNLPAQDLIAPQYRIDVNNATDDQVVNAVAAVVAAYAQGLQFKQDEFGRYIGSPYDVFLRINHLPVQPKAGETVAAYNQRLYQAASSLSNPIWVTAADGSFKYHTQTFQFGATELQGLLIFLRSATNPTDGSQHAGNCAACHQAPYFSDFIFHNNGVAQEEYDSVHGSGSFANLFIPGLSARNANYNAWLPVSANHPNASETFRRAAVADNPNYADLGLWNIYLNPDIPNPQAALKSFLCTTSANCATDQGLERTIALFKTPILRDLADSAPYFHNGSKLMFEDVVSFYINSSALARAGQLRNGAPELLNMSISSDDISALAAFLKSLTEDYDDA
jgi:cytochrome c peroxidase